MGINHPVPGVQTPYSSPPSPVKGKPPQRLLLLLRPTPPVRLVVPQMLLQGLQRLF